MPRACAYCGKQDAMLTRDHIFPRSLFPKSRARSNTPYLTVPACFPCNNGWSIDEPQFRNLLAVSGNPNPAMNELWHGPIERSFAQKDGAKRLDDLWQQLWPVQSETGERHEVYPTDDPRFARVLRNIVRGLHYYHGLGYPVAEEMVEVDHLRYRIPLKIETGVPVYAQHSDIVRYQFFDFAEYDGYTSEVDDPPVRSAWLLTFFENKRFGACVRK